MSATQLFQLVSAFSPLLPIMMSVVVLIGLPWPRHFLARAVVAVLVAWISSIFYTAFVYNPAGIASAAEQGIDSLAMKFDNNTIASTLAGGWIIPFATVCFFFAGRATWTRLRRLSSGA